MRRTLAATTALLLVALTSPAPLAGLAAQAPSTPRTSTSTPTSPASTSARLANTRYQATVLPDGAVDLRNTDGARATFRPVFTVLSRTDDPGLNQTLDTGTNFRVPTWKVPGATETTTSFFKAGTPTRMVASGHSLRDGTLTWTFPEEGGFTLTASLTLPEGSGEPTLAFRFSPKQAGWYTVGYTGAPDVAPAEAESIWQPLVWQERRFPQDSYLSLEHMCPVPAVMVGHAGATTAIVADPSEVPFRLPTLRNARFGLLVRTADGRAQPQIFAPAFGREASAMKAGDAFGFSLRLLVRQGDWLGTYRYVAQALYGFHDYRRNATASLNETIENMIAFAMDDRLSNWNEELKGFDYTTDVKGTVKVVSALHPLSIALVTDNPEVYARRALPVIEYLMSREKYLFAAQEKHEEHQNPSHLMKGPAAEVSELAALSLMSGGRSPVFAHYAESLFDKPRALNLLMVSEGGSWQSALALYRLTGREDYLRKAVDGATAYVKARVNRPQTDFSDARIMGGAGGQFWTDFSPKWIDLLELYETTRDKTFLDAAAYGARIYSTFVWLQPRVPDGDVHINPTGLLGIGDSHNKPNPRPMAAPPQDVPAWRVAQVGLTPEASNTYNGNPAVFLTHYAAYMMRLAHYTGDAFFKDVARSAVVGRYTNYPGYDINLEYTTIYQRPDYPLRDWKELTYNQFYYNHVWPHIALLMDYLMADALYKSKGQIAFPARYAQGYAYLQTQVYGDRPGTFYGDTDVRPWMPAKLARIDDVQVNYVAGRGKDALYLGLLNQSAAPVRARLSLNPDIVPLAWSRAYPVRVWKDGVRQPRGGTLKAGEIDVEIAPNGVTALAIDGLGVTATRFQDHALTTASHPLSAKSFAEQATPFGKVTGMLLSVAPAWTSSFVWLEATEQTLSEVTFHYRAGGDWNEVVDTRYPYELSLPLGDGDAPFEMWIEGKTPSGASVKTEPMRLERR